MGKLGDVHKVMVFGNTRSLALGRYIKVGWEIVEVKEISHTAESVVLRITRVAAKEG